MSDESESLTPPLFPEIENLVELENAVESSDGQTSPAEPILTRSKQTNNSFEVPKNKKQKLIFKVPQPKINLESENNSQYYLPDLQDTSLQTNVPMDNSTNVQTKKRRHGDILGKSPINNKLSEKPVNTEKFNSIYTTTNTSYIASEEMSKSATASEALSYVKSESADNARGSEAQYQLINMTKEDHLNVANKIKFKFPNASCHELCCRLCRFYQTANLEEALTWAYDSATSEYLPQQLTPAYQPYSSVVKNKEVSEDQVAQDKSINLYNSSSFPFTEACSIIVENQDNSFIAKEFIALDQTPAAQQSCTFSEFSSKLKLIRKIASSHNTITYGINYLYSSGSDPLEATNSGSHTIVFFSSTNFADNESSNTLYIDPQGHGSEYAYFR